MKHPADAEIDKIIEDYLGIDPIVLRYRNLVDKKYIHGDLNIQDHAEFLAAREMIELDEEKFYRPIIDKLKEAS